MYTLLLSLALITLTSSAHAGVPNDAFFHCTAWDNVSVGQSCFKVAYDACGRDVALAEQAECVAGFNGLPADQQQNPSLATEYCVDLLSGLTKDALCPRPVPSCLDQTRNFLEPCESSRGR